MRCRVTCQRQGVSQLRPGLPGEDAATGQSGQRLASQPRGAFHVAAEPCGLSLYQGQITRAHAEVTGVGQAAELGRDRGLHRVEIAGQNHRRAAGKFKPHLEVRGVIAPLCRIGFVVGDLAHRPHRLAANRPQMAQTAARQGLRARRRLRAAQHRLAYLLRGCLVVAVGAHDGLDRLNPGAIPGHLQHRRPRSQPVRCRQIAKTPVGDDAARGQPSSPLPLIGDERLGTVEDLRGFLATIGEHHEDGHRLGDVETSLAIGLQRGRAQAAGERDIEAGERLLTRAQQGQRIVNGVAVQPPHGHPEQVISALGPHLLHQLGQGRQLAMGAGQRAAPTDDLAVERVGQAHRDSPALRHHADELKFLRLLHRPGFGGLSQQRQADRLAVRHKLHHRTDFRLKVADAGVDDVGEAGCHGRSARPPPDPVALTDLPARAGGHHQLAQQQRIALRQPPQPAHRARVDLAAEHLGQQLTRLRLGQR